MRITGTNQIGSIHAAVIDRMDPSLSAIADRQYSTLLSGAVAPLAVKNLTAERNHLRPCPFVRRFLTASRACTYIGGHSHALAPDPYFKGILCAG